MEILIIGASEKNVQGIANSFIEVLENPNTYRKIYTILDGETLINDAFSPN